MRDLNKDTLLMEQRREKSPAPSGILNPPPLCYEACTLPLSYNHCSPLVTQLDKSVNFQSHQASLYQLPALLISNSGCVLSGESVRPDGIRRPLLRPPRLRRQGQEVEDQDDGDDVERWKTLLQKLYHFNSQSSQGDGIGQMWRLHFSLCHPSFDSRI